jgi:transcriptional regulator with XRE-family HTH domain
MKRIDPLLAVAGAAFRMWCIANKLRASDLAKMLGVSVRRAEHLRSGRHPPHPGELAKLHVDDVVAYLATVRVEIAEREPLP